MSSGLTLTKRPLPSEMSKRPTAHVILLLLHSKWFNLGCVIVVFLVIISTVPLASCVKIGADEDFELSKATLCNHGFRLYSDIWDDQPPLDTFLVAQISKTTWSAFLPRLMTVFFAFVLLISFFLLVHRISHLSVAVLTTAIVVASPGFIELASSAMQEIPALSFVVLSLLCAYGVCPASPRMSAVMAGISFGIALQLKLIGFMYLPLIALGIWIRGRPELRNTVILGLIFSFTAGVSFFAINSLTGHPFLLQFQTSWSAHFTTAQNLKYGSPSEHPYDWWILLRNWDISAPALVGIVFVWRRILVRTWTFLLPLSWLGLTLTVFPLHRPWWGYYYIHNVLPLSWCAAEGFVGVFSLLASLRAIVGKIFLGTFAVGVLAWNCARVYLEVSGIRSSPRLYSCQVLKEVARFKPFTRFLFADQPIYTFYAGIPMPPHLAVISAKRIWSGDMTDERMCFELQEAHPGLILRNNDGAVVPYQSLLEKEYRLVYRDLQFQLYAHRSISKLAR